MPGIIFVFLALFTSIFSTVIKKPILKHDSSHDAISYAIINNLLGGLFAITLYAFTSFHWHDFSSLLTPTIGLLIVLDIVVWAGGTFLFFPAYKHLPVSESTIILTIEGLFAFFFGLVLFKTETFQLQHLLGGILILASVLFVNQVKKWKTNIYTLFCIIAAGVFGLAIVVDNAIITRANFSSPLFLEIWNFGLMGILMIFLYHKRLSKFSTILAHKKALLTVFINSFSTFSSFFLVYNAYKRGIVASQANLILSSQTAIVVILGIIVFKEKGGLKKKLIAAAIASVGVYLLS